MVQLQIYWPRLSPSFLCVCIIIIIMLTDRTTELAQREGEGLGNRYNYAIRTSTTCTCLNRKYNMQCHKTIKLILGEYPNNIIANKYDNAV